MFGGHVYVTAVGIVLHDRSYNLIWGLGGTRALSQRKLATASVGIQYKRPLLLTPWPCRGGVKEERLTGGRRLIEQEGYPSTESPKVGIMAVRLLNGGLRQKTHVMVVREGLWDLSRLHTA